LVQVEAGGLDPALKNKIVFSFNEIPISSATQHIDPPGLIARGLHTELYLLTRFKYPIM
jgi:hypothetical protein